MRSIFDDLAGVIARLWGCIRRRVCWNIRQGKKAEVRMKYNRAKAILNQRIQNGREV